MNQSPWFQQAEVSELLHQLVDKLDKTKAGAARRAIKLDAKTFPALFKAAFESDKENYWSQLQQMQEWGWFRIKTDRIQPGKAGYELNPRLEIIDADAIRAAIDRLEPIKSAQHLWREAVYDLLQANDAIKQRVAAQKLEIPGKSAREIVAKLNLLPAFIEKPLFLRELSAKLFWRSSKVLDNRQALIMAILQVDECPFPEAPIQLQVFLPEGEFTGVLFIENLVSFERATLGKTEHFDGLTLVFASGFKGTAKRLRTKSGASVYFSGLGNLELDARQRFLCWLFECNIELPVWFWGDLDYSGMQIIKSLRHSFSQLEAWQPGYQPMLDALLAGEGHAAGGAKKDKQKPVSSTGSNYADQELLPALVKKSKFLDQEF
jgi:hypothetical protein